MCERWGRGRRWGVLGFCGRGERGVREVMSIDALDEVLLGA